MNEKRASIAARLAGRWPTILAAIGLGLLVAWLLPRRSREVVLVDGSGRWPAAARPLQRTIAWRPAEPLPAGPEDLAAADSLVRPQFAEGGRAIYFTRQRPGHDADIYRAEFDGDRWLPAEPVEAINSGRGDYGPFISPDGRTLLLYSERDGGFGGYDIYVSRREDRDWGTPENLGPLVNSPAHEYDPCLSPDGRRLFFASNRSPRMEQRLAEAAAAGGVAAPWQATLRADVALERFDIHVAERSGPDAAWSAAANLRAVNLPGSNEGEPTLSTDGAFLYFVSDRPNPSGAAGNYDIYRVRFTAGGASAVQNLGAGINTAANEHDPALSSDGFRIVFSSDRSGTAAERYALYSSLAAETCEETVWSTSHLQAIGRHWWWLTLLALLGGLIAAVVWYLRDVSRRRAPVPVFFLASLIVHLLLISGAFLVPIQGVTVAERIREKLEQFVATDVVLESNPVEDSVAPQPFQTVAGPQQPVESESVAPVTRQAAPDPTTPSPLVPPTEVRLSTAFNSEPIPDRVTNADPVVVQQIEQPALGRRESIADQMLAESVVAIDPLPAARQAPAEPAAVRESVAPARLTSEPRVAVTPAAVASQPSAAPERIVADPVGRLSDGSPAPATPAPKARPASLPRQDRVADVSVAETEVIPTAAVAAAPAARSGPEVAGIEVKVARSAPAAPLAGGPPAPAREERVGMRLASLDGKAIGGRPESGSAMPSARVTVALGRRRPAADTLLAEGGQIGLQQMLRQRVVDETSKRELVEAFGGRAETLESIRRGLRWLAVVQHADGRWKLDAFPDGPNGEKYDGRGAVASDVGATGLALLPFLGDGNVPIAGPYQETVTRGLRWLVSIQKPDGCLDVGQPGNGLMYAHAMATIAVCEAFGMSHEGWLQEPAQRALDFIVAAQHDQGGWRYRPKQAGDLSVVGWQVMALKSGQMAGLTVPGATLEKAQAFLETCRAGPNRNQFAYEAGRAPGRPGITAEGLLCMQYLGWKRDTAEVAAVVDFMMGHLPEPRKHDSYYVYYGTQALFHVQGEPWQRWNRAMSDTLLSTQIKDGPHVGTWDPHDEYERQGGRIYATSLRLLMLEVYFRHLPLYKLVEEPGPEESRPAAK
jgi:hypothetical protein